MSPKKQINIRVSEAELMVLKQYCEQEDREQSDVIREFIRSLKRKIRTDTSG
jgi:protein-arginine kinase activator protein McsA